MNIGPPNTVLLYCSSEVITQGQPTPGVSGAMGGAWLVLSLPIVMASNKCIASPRFFFIYIAEMDDHQTLPIGVEEEDLDHLADSWMSSPFYSNYKWEIFSRETVLYTRGSRYIPDVIF